MATSRDRSPSSKPLPLASKNGSTPRLAQSRPGHAHGVRFREAALASAFFVGVAVGFGIAFGLIAGWDHGTEYFAGYIVEKSLSVDNLFVFVVIISTFAVPAEHQQRLLTFGILAALLMRAVFIALGAPLIAAFNFMFLIFGLLLLVTAIQLFRHRDQDPDIEDNALVKLARKAVPVTSDYDDLVILGVTIVASLLKSRRDPDARAHAGSLGAPPERRPREGVGEA